MTPLALALANVAAWSAQVGALALGAAALERALPVERPRARLALVQGLLALVVALPLVQPWPVVSGSVSWSTAASPAGDPGASLGPPAAPPRRRRSPGGWPRRVLLAAGAFLRLARFARALVELHALGNSALPLGSPAVARGAARRGCAPRAFRAGRPRLRAGHVRTTSAARAAASGLRVARARGAGPARAPHCFTRDAATGSRSWGRSWSRPPPGSTPGSTGSWPAPASPASSAWTQGSSPASAAVRATSRSLVEAARARSFEHAVPAAPFFGESHLRNGWNCS